ncbi:MAG: polyphenol oxidase family protein [bacterium]|jgi:YfiH family protein|nr:MAG: laccase domain-containing protein [bacterium]
MPGSAVVARVREERVGGPVPWYVHRDWAARFPWLIQGITGRGDGPEPFDLGLSGSVPVGTALGRWRTLRDELGCERAVHARQVHGARLLWHGSGAPGLTLADAADGHATRAEGVLLTVSVADCVPVFLVDPEERAIALLHAGWRGTAAGILEAGVRALVGAGSRPGALHMHCGPAICGECYEVGPEVHAALGLPAPTRPTPVDLRAVLVDRAMRLGLDPAKITVSEFCTRCGPSPFFSHRAGHTGRQFAGLALRPGAGG